MQCRQQPTLISFLSNNSYESHLLLAILLSAISAASSAESILCTHQYLSTLILGLFHFIIPNRAFQIYDVVANLSGVLFAYFIIVIYRFYNKNKL